MYRLFARAGWGSALVEAQLAYHGLTFELEEVDDLFRSAKARERLSAINPVAQVPTLILPDGEVMTESAAITLYLADAERSDRLVPAPDATERPRFLRWLIFMVANIYPTFTFADDPSRFVEGDAARTAFRQSIDRYQQGLWGTVEGAAGAPWFLGERLSALDIYIAVMTRWRPGRAWFRDHCPRVAAIAERADEIDGLKAVWARNFPPGVDPD